MKVKPSDAKQVAEAILGLSYVDMTEMGDLLASSAVTDKEEDNEFDPTNRDEWCERLRWWATGYIEALEDSK